jgi:hypothetical protein
MDNQGGVGLPSTPTGLVRYFTKVWRQHAQPVIRSGDRDQTLAIPAGPWGPKATVWFNQPWVRWGAIAMGQDIFVASRRVSAGLLAHEYTHTLQTEQAGGFLPYLRTWARLTARYGYRGNQFEVEGYAAPAQLERELAAYGARDDRVYGPGELWHPAHVRTAGDGPILTYAGVEYRRPGTTDPRDAR